MPAVRALCRPGRQNALVLTKNWQSTTSSLQMRQVSGGSTAGPSVPLALDLPPAHTSRGAPCLRVICSRQRAARIHFRAFGVKNTCLGPRFSFPPSVISYLCRCVHRWSCSDTIRSFPRVTSICISNPSGGRCHQR